MLFCGTYIRHNYHFRLKCTGSFYSESSSLCMSNKFRCWCMFRIRSDMAYILDAFYHHNNQLDSYLSISHQMKNVRYGMLCTVFPMNHYTFGTMNDMMHSCEENREEAKEKLFFAHFWNKFLNFMIWLWLWTWSCYSHCYSVRNVEIKSLNTGWTALAVHRWKN